jgi:hypothetical protein
MRTFSAAALFVMFCVPCTLLLAAENPLVSDHSDEQGLDSLTPAQAIQRYLHEIEEIEKGAAQAKAAARAQLLKVLGQEPGAPLAPAPRAKESTPGLIGTATIEGEPSRVAFHYEHGKLFPRELIWDRFHKPTADGGVHRPNISITLLGKVEVPHEMTVKVRQAAGGVNGDHGTLYIGDRQIGQVGDDTAKAEVYVLTLPAGVHPVRWVLTGGTFQNNLLKFEDAQTGELLRVFYDDAQYRESGAAEAREGVEACADPTEWLKALGDSHWRWVPLAN